jgi:hypothetical protein
VTTCTDFGSDGEDEFGAGLTFFQGEIGNRSCTVEPAVLCGRSMGWTTWGRIVGERWTMRHAGQFNREAVFSTLRDSVDRQIPLLSTAVNKLLALKKVEVPQRLIPNLIVYFSKRGGVSSRDAQGWHLEFIQSERKGDNAYELVDAFLAYTKGLGDEIRIKYTELPQVIASEDWTRVLGAANNIHTTEVESFLQSGISDG